MKKHVQRSAIGIGLLVSLLVAAIPVGASAQILSPSQAIYGMTNGEWSAAWWQWLLSLPNAKNPYYDANCGSGQGSGPVFFLVGGGDATHTASRVCDVPLGKAVFFPIINGECSTAEPKTVYYGSNDRELRVCASKILDGIDINTLSVTVDGETLQRDQLTAFRAQSPVFHFTDIPRDNFLTPAPGTKYNKASSGFSVSDGYWVMVEPLSLGSHTIKFQGTIATGPSPFSQSVEYQLNVVAPAQ